jgi:hypothetical protein
MDAPAPDTRRSDDATTWGQYFSRIEPFLTGISPARSIDPEPIGDMGSAEAQIA